MTRAKSAVGLVVMLGVCLFSAAPASAEFESTSGQTTGAAKAAQGMEFTFEKEGAIKCPHTEAVKAQWQIQAKGQVKQTLTPVKGGPNLLLQVKSWGECEALIGSTKAKAEIGECNLQLQQSSGAPAAVYGKACVIKAAPCTIQIPAAMEGVGAIEEEGEVGIGVGINDGLEENAIENTGKGELTAKLDMTKGSYNQSESSGLMAFSSGTLCPLKHKTETGTLKGEFVNNNIKLLALEFNPEGTGVFNATNAVNSRPPSQRFYLQPHINVRGALFVCNNAKYTGSLAANGGSILVIPPAAYETCKEERSNRIANVTTANCRYRYVLTSGVANSTTRFVGRMQIVNSGVCAINFESLNCKIKVLQQADPTNTVNYTNFIGGNPKELEISNAVVGFQFTVEEFAGCNGFTANDTYSASSFLGIFKLNNVFITA